jgi:hypothetical protein
VGLNAGGRRGELNMHAVAAHRNHLRRLDHQDAAQLRRLGELRALRDFARASLGRLLVRGDEKRDRHALRQCAGRDNGRSDRPLHVCAAETVQHAALDPRLPRIIAPAGFRHSVHVS